MNRMFKNLNPITFLLAIALFVSQIAIAQTPFKISHGPYLQALDATSVTVIWTTNDEATGWLELAPNDSTHFYRAERPKFFASNHGFKNIGKIHKVTLKNLKPGTTYRYRVCSQQVISHVGHKVRYGDIASTVVYKKEPLKFTTTSLNQKAIEFGIINDIHGRNDVMEKLLGNLDFTKTDLVFFNGDMSNDLRSEEQLFSDFMDTGTKVFASQVPMYYARGNHETRGQYSSAFPQYFISTTGQLYYLVRRGPICFIVLDCGEDKPDSDIEYSGISNMDFYRTEQAEWLKEAVKQPDYVNAPYKVVICHIPPFEGWHGEHEILEKFVPILNDAGAQIMISGHLHRHVKTSPNSKVKFPVLVNSNNNMIHAKGDGQKLVFEVKDQTGKVVDSIQLSPSK